MATIALLKFANTHLVAPQINIINKDHHEGISSISIIMSNKMNFHEDFRGPDHEKESTKRFEEIMSLFTILQTSKD